MAPPALTWSADTTPLERGPHPRGVEAQRALGAVADADRPELCCVLAHPILGYAKHAGDGLAVEQAERLADAIGEQFRNAPGDVFQCQLVHPESPASAALHAARSSACPT